MKIAVLSNTRACELAVNACLNKISTLNIDRIIVLGGYFGFFDATHTFDLLTQSTLLFSDGDKQQCGIFPLVSYSIYSKFQKPANKRHAALVQNGKFYEMNNGILFTAQMPQINNHSVTIRDLTIGQNFIAKNICFGPPGSKPCAMTKTGFIRNKCIKLKEIVEFTQVSTGLVFDPYNLGTASFSTVDNDEINFFSISYDTDELKKAIIDDKSRPAKEKDQLMKRLFKTQQNQTI